MKWFISFLVTLWLNTGSANANGQDIIAIEIDSIANCLYDNALLFKLKFTNRSSDTFFILRDDIDEINCGINFGDHTSIPNIKYNCLLVSGSYFKITEPSDSFIDKTPVILFTDSMYKLKECYDLYVEPNRKLPKKTISHIGTFYMIPPVSSIEFRSVARLMPDALTSVNNISKEQKSKIKVQLKLFYTYYSTSQPDPKEAFRLFPPDNNLKTAFLKFYR